MNRRLDRIRAALEHAPGETIDRLLDLARPEQASTLVPTDQPLPILAAWMMEDSRVGSTGIRERRALVANRLGPFRARGGDRSIAVEAFLSVFTPQLEVSDLAPLGNTVRLYKAVISRSTITGLEDIWTRCHKLLLPVDGSIWQALASLLWHYAYPETLLPGSPLDAEHKRALQALGGHMLSDLAAASLLGPGLRSAFSRVAQQIGQDLHLDLDPDFELLFPEEDPRAASASSNKDCSLATLVERWSEDSPKLVAARIAALESEARVIGQEYPRNTPAVAKEIAKQCPEPGAWARALIDEEIANDVLEPFLEACLDRADGTIERLLSLCLERSIYPICAVSIGLRLDGPPDALRTGIAALLPNWTRLVRLEALRGSVPPTTLAWLFGHASDDVAVAAALGAWQHSQGQEPSEGLAQVWRSAILRHRPREMRPRGDIEPFEHDLVEIFVRDPVLAEAWVAKALTKSETFRPIDANGALAQATLSLDEAARKRLVVDAKSAPALRFLARFLVRRSVAAYQALLERSFDETDCKTIHLAPLAGKPDAAWETMATQALEHGYPPPDLAHASIWGSGGGLGGHVRSSGSYWTEWIDAFRTLEASTNVRLQAVGRAGREQVEQMDNQERARVRRRALYGV